MAYEPLYKGGKKEERTETEVSVRYKNEHSCFNKGFRDLIIALLSYFVTKIPVKIGNSAFRF